MFGIVNNNAACGVDFNTKRLKVHITLLALCLMFFFTHGISASEVGERKNLLRNRKAINSYSENYYIEDIKREASTSQVGSSQETSHTSRSDVEDSIFLNLGKPGALFKNKEYDAALPSICVLASKSNPEAEYVIGLFHENGFGKIIRSPGGASEYYSKAVMHSKENSPVWFMAKEAVGRVLRSIFVS